MSRSTTGRSTGVPPVRPAGIFACISRFALLVALLSPAQFALAADDTAGMAKPPSEAEVRAFLTKEQQESAMHDPARPALKADVTVSEIKIGGKIKKQVGRGEEALEVWAVKANVVTKISLKNGTEQTRELKLDPGEAWFFYRDAFGEWTAKHGRSRRKMYCRA